jgi:hypothetical protein
MIRLNHAWLESCCEAKAENYLQHPSLPPFSLLTVEYRPYSDIYFKDSVHFILFYWESFSKKLLCRGCNWLFAIYWKSKGLNDLFYVRFDLLYFRKNHMSRYYLEYDGCHNQKECYFMIISAFYIGTFLILGLIMNSCSLREGFCEFLEFSTFLKE